MIEEIRGRVLRIGDDIDTDQIYPARYIELTEEREMARHALEGLDTELPAKLANYTILVAGKNLGCGSSREHAARSLLAAGIRALVAESFARIFFRNAINLGLPAIQLPSTVGINTGDLVAIRLMEGILINEKKEVQVAFRAFSQPIVHILKAGGLVGYYKKARGAD